MHEILNSIEPYWLTRFTLRVMEPLGNQKQAQGSERGVTNIGRRNLMLGDAIGTTEIDGDQNSAYIFSKIRVLQITEQILRQPCSRETTSQCRKRIGSFVLVCGQFFLFLFVSGFFVIFAR